MQAQNLVPNPSFEDANICEYHQPCSPSGWFYVTRNAVAGYFENDIPAATGKRWLSIVAGNRINAGGRQYWETMLLHKLEKGKPYKIGLSIHGWDIGPNANDIGIFFIREPKYYNTDTLIQPPTYFSFAGGRLKQQTKSGWFRLEKEYVADKDDQYIMIGNFSSDNYQEIAKKRYSKSAYTGLLVDDLEITPIEKIACEDCERVKDSLYLVVNRHSSVDTAAPVHKSDTITGAERRTDTLLLQDIYFPFSSFRISNPDTLKRYRGSFENVRIKQIRIAGYTDDVGTVEANQKLSLKRAQEVGRLLNVYFNIPASLLTEEGYGISKHNSDKSKNRRVEIYIYRD